MLINQYRPGAGIGWHRDKTQFDEVVGVSLLAPCVLRFRRKTAETWDRASLTVKPRSAYLLSGTARTVWEHSIPPLVAKPTPAEQRAQRARRLRRCSFRLHRENSHRFRDRTTQ